MGMFSGKTGLVLGVANDRSIAWAMAEAMRTLSSAGVSSFDEMRDHAARKSCLGRNVEPKELGTTGLYLLSDLSGGVTGETIHVDCGYNVVGL